MKRFALPVLFALCPALLLAARLEARLEARLTVRIFPQDAKIAVISANSGRTNRLANGSSVDLAAGSYVVTAQAPGYLTSRFPVTVSNRSVSISDRLIKDYAGLEFVARVPVSAQPKSVVWLDDRRFIVNLLNGSGIEVFDFTNHLRTYKFSAKWCRESGFVEGLVDAAQNEFYVSQMTTGMFHVFNLATLAYKTNYSTRGTWTKVIAEDAKYLYMSNWLSKDVTVFDRFTKEFVARVKLVATPRGMAFSPDGKYLYVAIFDDALLQKIDLSTFKVVKNIRLAPGGGNARHIVPDPAKGLFYVSDMGRDCIYKFDTASDKVVAEVKVFNNPNTICLSADRTRLFVSCRGPNGSNGYLNKGEVFGRVYVVNTVTMKVEDWVWGGNQPTGLEVSPDGRWLVFSNFLDYTLEFYRIHTGMTRTVYGD